MKIKPLIFTLVLLSFAILDTQSVSAQDYYDSLRIQLDSLADTYPGLNEGLDLGVSGAGVKEFLRSVADNHELNISVVDGIEGRVTNNFTDANVIDVLVFISREFDLRMEVFGSILSFYKTEKPPVKKELTVSYNNLNEFLSFDFKNDSIADVVKAITAKTGKNVLYSPEAEGKRVSAFVQNRPFENALELLAESNGLELDMRNDEVFFFKMASKPDPVKDTKKAMRTNTPGSNRRGPAQDFDDPDQAEIKYDSLGKITVDVHDIELNELISRVASVTGTQYFLYSKVEGKISTYIDNVSFRDFLGYVLNGTSYTYNYDKGLYFIGKRDHESLKTTELIKLEHRTIETVLDLIPPDLKEGLEIIEVVELNGFAVSGSKPAVRWLKNFLASIDQIVPVIKIDVLIVDVSKTASISAGMDLSFGGDNVPDRTQGKLSPGLEVEGNSNFVNSMIEGFNGLGIVNLGRVSSGFFASLRALESNGIVKLRSTPMLATLNGHEATLRIGNTEYYLELRNDLIGTQNPLQQQSQVYKSVNADLSVSIKPVVSSGSDVTLTIQVNQSDFTPRISETAPPGSVDRQFESYIRVKDGEMILLGGLEEKSKSETGSGLPWISRVPVLKWFFSSRSKEKQKSQLNIFIRPTVIY